MTDPKSEWLSRMADHVLLHGLNDATLRPLARAAGTSDRMLNYYFGAKDALIAALLDHLAQKLTGLMDTAEIGSAASTTSLSAAILDLMRSAGAEPYLQVWLEVIAGSARGQAAYREAASRIIAHFHTWLMARLPRETPMPEAVAAAMLIQIEGTLLIAMAGKTGQALIETANTLAQSTETAERPAR